MQGHPRVGQPGSSSPGESDTTSPPRQTPSKAWGSQPSHPLQQGLPHLCGGPGMACRWQGDWTWEESKKTPSGHTGPGVELWLLCLQRHALFSFRACLRKMRALDSPEPLQSQCTLTPKGPPHLLEKTYSLATGRFALRQHHLLALLGMTPIPSWATPES